jgi:uncharacterized protein YaeQ
VSNPSTKLYRFRINLSDIERGVYEELDFRIAQHPSENLLYLFTRIIAFALNAQEGLAFSSQGLGDPDSPALLVHQANGGIDLWVEIGSPSPRKLHKATKAAKKVKVYTYKDPDVLLRDLQSEKIHKSEEIEIYSIKANFLENITKDLPKDVRMSMIYNDRILSIDFGDKSGQTEIVPHRI